MQIPPSITLSQTGARSYIWVLAVVFVLVVGLAAGRKSLTWDEPTFIISGYTYLAEGDYRLNPEAPPLAQKLCALPLLFLDLVPPDYESGYSASGQVAFARSFLRTNITEAERLAFWARLPIWVLGGCLVLLAGFWSLRLYGPGSGVLTALLVTLSPNLTAHARLATTDFACALGMLAAVATFQTAARSASDRRAALLGLVTGLALLAKYTSLLLGPIFLVLGLYEWRARKTPLSSLLRTAGIAASVGYLTITLGYGDPLDPRPYLAGIDQVYVRAAAGYQTYLLGHVYDGPVWYYHIAAFLIKTPAPTLIILLIACGGLLVGHRRTDAAVYLLLPVVVVIAASCFDPSNIGLRRILPAYPFLFIFAGQALLRESCRLCTATMACLLIWLAAEAALIYPNHLSYFNVLAGGPMHGPYLMDDSNLDWGQDLPALADWQRKNAADDALSLSYFGTMPPEAYGIRYQPMPNSDIVRPSPGLYAISAHQLVWFRKIGQKMDRNLDWLTRFEPVARAGYSIYIYRFD